MNITEQLIRDEGVERSAYQDHLGFWTIGVGRLIDKRKGGGLSDEEIEYLLQNDIKEKKGALLKALPWVSSLSEARQGVLINMAFQMGITGLLGFKTTLGYIKAGKFEDAAISMGQSLWAKQTPERCKRLQKQLITNEWK